MALENLVGADKGINDLVVANPDGLDPKSEGDNHIRGLKNILVNVFGLMLARATSLPVVGAVLKWDGTRYTPAALGPENIVPVGTIFDFAGSLAAIPAGYLDCNGVAVNRTTYAALFAVLGGAASPYGPGDGITTFNLPDLRRRVTIGSGGTGTGTINSTTGSVGGAETHTLTAAEISTHTHTATQAAHNHAYSFGNAAGAFEGHITSENSGAGVTNASRGYGTTDSKTPVITVGNAGGGGAHNNIQPSVVMTKIIKF